MELLPVKRGTEQKNNDELKLSPEQMQLGNVRVDTIQNSSIGDQIILTGTLNFDETKLALVDETGVRIVDLDSAVPTHIFAGETSCGLCWANRPLLILM